MLMMNRRFFRFATLCAVLTALTLFAYGKRVAPKPVAPVVSNGIKYSARGDGRDQYVVATAASTGSELWKAKVFHTRIKFWTEEDVQWIFITDLKIVNHSLFVRDENARCYSVEILKNHRVHRTSCAAFGEKQAEP